MFLNLSNRSLLLISLLALAGACLSLLGYHRLHTGAEAAGPRAEGKSPHDLGATLPLAFEQNQGQSEPQVRFLSRGPGYALFLTDQEAVLALRSPEKQGSERRDRNGADAVLRIAMDGANTSPVVRGIDELPIKSNYLIGEDREGWQNNISNVAKVKYEEIYPGIDLVYYGRQRQLEYDFIVRPGAEPHNIRMRFEGARDQRIDSNGNLYLSLDGGELSFTRPIVYQLDGEARREIRGEYLLLADGGVGFQLGSYDVSLPLIIDPMLSMSTYLGGFQADRGAAIAISGSHVYLAGETLSSRFPVTDRAYATIKAAGSDVFVMKYDAYLAGNITLPGGFRLYSTFLGGDGDDRAYGIAVDGVGSAYITGETSSANFPVTSATAVQDSKAGSALDIFLVKLDDKLEVLQYSTYLGSTGRDSARAIALQTDANDPTKFAVYLGGETESLSTGWPGIPVINSHLNNDVDGFAAKFNSDLSGLDYFVFLGGSGDDQVTAISLDKANSELYLTGRTDSVDFPAISAYQSTLRGSSDAFVVKLDQYGAFANAGYLGGSGDESGYGIARNESTGHIYVAGDTSSTDFPIFGAEQDYNAGGKDAFFTRFSSGGTTLDLSTYLGGSGDDQVTSLAVDSQGYAYAVGHTTSQEDFPLVNPFQGLFLGAIEGFALQLDANGLKPVFSTLFGGSGADSPASLAIDSLGNMFITGTTTSTNFPLSSPEQAMNIGGDEAFLIVIANNSLLTDLSISSQGIPDPVRVGQQLIFKVYVTNNGPDYASGVVVVDTLPPNVEYESVNATYLTGGGCTISGADVTCILSGLNAGDVAEMTVMVTAKSSGTFANKAMIARASQSDPNPANNMVIKATAVKGGSIGGGALVPWLILLLAGVSFYRAAGRRFQLH